MKRKRYFWFIMAISLFFSGFPFHNTSLVVEANSQYQTDQQAALSEQLTGAPLVRTGYQPCVARDKAVTVPATQRIAQPFEISTTAKLRGIFIDSPDGLTNATLSVYHRDAVSGEPTGSALTQAVLERGETFDFMRFGSSTPLINAYVPLIAVIEFQHTTRLWISTTCDAAPFLTADKNAPIWESHHGALALAAFIMFDGSTGESCAPDQPGGLGNVVGDTWKAQTFHAQASGWLKQVQLLGIPSPKATLNIFRVDATGYPTGPALATTQAIDSLQFTFENAPFVEQGREYVLALHSEQGSYWWKYSSSSACVSDGTPWTSLDNGQSWFPDIVDLYFTTLIGTDQSSGTPINIPPVHTVNVFVINLPFPEPPTYDVTTETQHGFNQIREATRYHGYDDPFARSFYEYKLYNDQIIFDTAMPPRLPNNYYDIGWVYQRHDLCTKIQQGDIDEVWLWVDGGGGLPEWVVAGPRWSEGASYTDTPNCGRQIATMIWNYTRGIEALHSYGHRLEGQFGQFEYGYRCDLFTVTWPWVDPTHHCDAIASDRTGFVGRPFSGNDWIGVCGDIHFPPNILDHTDYFYDSPTVVNSICEDWQQDGTAQAQTIDCTDWQCSEYGYMIWWMQNVPGLYNTNHRQDGTYHPNWWELVVDPMPLALSESSVQVVPASVVSNEFITYTLSLVNTSPAAGVITLTSTLPASIQPSSASPSITIQGQSIDLTTYLAARTTHSYTVTARIAEGFHGTITSSFTLDSVSTGAILLEVPVINVELPLTATFSISGTDSLATPQQFSPAVVGGYAPYTYLWDFGDGITTTETTPTHIYTHGGTYTVSLRVTDRDQRTTIVTRSLTISADLSADFSYHPSTVAHTVSFTPTVQGGTVPYTYLWAFGDGTGSTDMYPVHQYAGAGSYTATLTVTDARQHIHQTSHTVIIPDQPAEPLVVDWIITGLLQVDQPVTFTAYIQGGHEPWIYNWEFGDGTTSSFAKPTHVYDQAGIYTVKLTVIDVDSTIVSVIRDINVEPRTKSRSNIYIPCILN